jgi:prophage regulatory protein
MARNNQTQPQLPAEGFVRLSRVLEHFPVGRSTWWNGVKAGVYPQPVKLSERIQTS